MTVVLYRIMLEGPTFFLRISGDLESKVSNVKVRIKIFRAITDLASILYINMHIYITRLCCMLIVLLISNASNSFSLQLCSTQEMSRICNLPMSRC